MSILYSYFKSADDPSRPLTFPTSRKQEVREGPSCRGVMRNLSSGLYSITDFCWTVWKSTFGADAVSPIRPGYPEVQNRPIDISLLEFPMNDIKKMKEKIKGTVNDVISGVIFYGVNLYMHACGHNSKGANVTAIVAVNTRILRAYQTVEEMTKPNSKAPWGNNIALLSVAVPMCKDSENVDPLYFIGKTSKTIKAKKNSHGLFLTGLLLKTMGKVKGPEAIFKYMHKTMKNTSLGISNLVGPTEQMMIANHPIDKFYFVATGGPHSVFFGVVSYMGRLNVIMRTERGFINPTLMVNCIEKSFQRILEAAT
ncbi:O-acyltransferase WSD1 [Rhynchospora pubera]|uniref:O-acyltransferase WSD1 n=1 Tax=Rhynchospora pubera TaxID=906938 RepID=A0AAV8DP14_9POAL|nr:O-acyltransferase WSD1 [Rhynchospora pubera]